MNNIEDALKKYIEELSSAGAASAKVIKHSAENEIVAINELKGISMPSDLKTFLSLANGYNEELCDELDVMDPEFAWGMYLLDIEECISQYENLAGCGGDENQDYWPLGFLPILWDGSSNYIVVNCIEGSGTFGGVYDMCDGVGCNLLSRSLSDFLNGSRIVLKENLRTFEDAELSDVSVSPQEYVTRCASIFGDTPYFQRVGGNMDTQIIDWK